MSKNPHSSPLDIQDYLDATSAAASRTRKVTEIMMILCMFVFAGLLNSFQSQWTGERLRAINKDPHGGYVQRHLGPAPTPPAPEGIDCTKTPEHAKCSDYPKRLTEYGERLKVYDKRLDAFYTHLARSYVETGFAIRVPIVGFTFDVNDLGLIAGIAFIGIMMMLRFCLTREVDNLREGFKAAERMNQLEAFYTILAMHQVFTVPKSARIQRTRLLVILPKAICALPLCLQTWVAVFDASTAELGWGISHVRTWVTLGADFGTLALIAALTPMAVMRLLTLDDLWQENWRKIRKAKRLKRAAAVNALPPVVAHVL